MRGTVVPNKPWARAQGERAPFHPAGVPRARVPVRPAVMAWKESGSHLHPLALQLEHACPQGADPAEEGLSMFRRRDAQAHQVPERRAGHTQLARTLFCSPSLRRDRGGPRTMTQVSLTHWAAMAATASRLP